jgi:two-component system LytT family response regulator
MRKVIYVDDELVSRVHFEKLIENQDMVELMGCFDDAEKALDFCISNPPDLAILDIEMDGKNGLWLAKELKDIGIPFAFCTSYTDYALPAFELDALHFIKKPMTADSLKSVIKRHFTTFILTSKQYQAAGASASKELSDNADYPRRLFVNTQKQILVLQLSEVIYISANGSYTNFHMEDESVVVSGKTMKFYTTLLLKNPDFIKIHRSYIINQSHLEAINKRKQEIAFIFKNKSTIKVANFKKEKWMDSFL